MIKKPLHNRAQGKELKKNSFFSAEQVDLTLIFGGSWLTVSAHKFFKPKIFFERNPENGDWFLWEKWAISD